METALLCPVCSSSRIHDQPFQYRYRDRTLRAKECLRCRIIFLHPQPTADELKQLYAADYFEGGDFRCGHEGGYCDPSTLERIQDPGVLLQIKAMKGGGRFLEIGCAGGAFLNTARNLGFQVQGVELSHDACRIAIEKFGLQVYAGDVLDARYPDRSFDVIFLGDVIEHLPDPLTTLREIHRILDTEGMLVMALPSQTNNFFSRISFSLYRFLGKTATVALPPYHLFEYRPRSLEYLLTTCGFVITRLDQDIIPPTRINLRGPALQRIGKLLFQYPNWAMTRVFHAFGDRMTVFAAKQFPRPTTLPS